MSSENLNKRWKNKDIATWSALNYFSENNSNTASSNSNKYHLQKPKHERTGIELFNNQCISHAREKSKDDMSSNKDSNVAKLIIFFYRFQDPVDKQ